MQKGDWIVWKYYDDYGTYRSLTGKLMVIQDSNWVVIRSDGGQPGYPKGKLIRVPRYQVHVTKSKNPISSLDDWVPCHAIRMTPQGIQVLREKNPSRGRCKNIAMGFRDSRGIFHPIRASSDYDEEEVGERLDTPRKRTRRKVAAKKKATKKKVVRKSRKRKR